MAASKKDQNGTQTKAKDRSNGNGKLKAKDFASDQEVRWCPGCGDYTILKQVQSVMPDLDVPRENIVFVSGIGCAARFPYYMETYGMHSIHGRAPAIATGLKVSRPELSVWIVTGDGDSLAIGTNHFTQILRRNLDVNILLFNNQIYGLTKGQYSPTSNEGTVTKSTPQGSVDHPFDPVTLALGSHGTFIARAMDRDPKHLKKMLMRSYQHRGSSLVEIYQNCLVFNDGIFEPFTNKKSRSNNTVYLEHNEPLIFGDDDEYGIRLDGTKPEVVELSDGYSKDDLWIHDETDPGKAYLLARYLDDPDVVYDYPRPFGVFYDAERPLYEEDARKQMEQAKEKSEPDLQKLLAGAETWEIK